MLVNGGYMRSSLLASSGDVMLGVALSIQFCDGNVTATASRKSGGSSEVKTKPLKRKMKRGLETPQPGNCLDRHYLLEEF